MPRRICPTMEDHEWVTDLRGRTHCQACGLKLEDADEAHVMQDLEDLERRDWSSMCDYP